jgi:hypothetical protein
MPEVSYVVITRALVRPARRSRLRGRRPPARARVARIRALPEVRGTESFVYLRLAKQKYDWAPDDRHTADVQAPSSSLADSARDHLWMPFSRHSTYEQVVQVPVIVRGEGAYIWDDRGRRYLDGLAGLFVVQVGHGRTELAEAAAKQASELAFFPLWSYAHPKAIELAERLAHAAPG